MRIARRRTNQGECVKPLAHAASGRRWMAPKKRRVPTNPAGGSAAWAAKRRSGAAAAASSTSNVNDDDDDDDDDAPQDGSTNADGTGDDMSQGGGGSASVGEASSSSASQSFDCGDIEVDAVATDPVGLVGCRVVVPWKDTRNKRQRTAASLCVVAGDVPLVSTSVVSYALLSHSWRRRVQRQTQ
jgi:hypothetical protein